MTKDQIVSVDSRGAHDVLMERKRQIVAEGWTPAHDDQHSTGEIALAAACYALHRAPVLFTATDYWPWDPSWWKPRSRRRDLVRAAALLIAEIDRLDRAEEKSTP
jgi:hypothetical protein